jgi:hypothetical protein
MLEKPMVQTEKEADELEAARVRNNVVVFVGFMRRYALAFKRFKEEIAGQDIKYVRVRDIIGDVSSPSRAPRYCFGGQPPRQSLGTGWHHQNQHFTPQTGMYQKMYSDLPAEAGQDLKQRVAANLCENFGPGALANVSNAGSWQILTAFSSHALSAMRDAIGMPSRVLSASRKGDTLRPNWWQVVFDYGQFNAIYEVGSLRGYVGSADCPDGCWRRRSVWCSYRGLHGYQAHQDHIRQVSQGIDRADPSPYIRALPVKLKIQSSTPNQEFSEQTIRSTYIDFYNLALLELYAAITEGKPFPTTVADGKADVVLTKMIMDAAIGDEAWGSALESHCPHAGVYKKAGIWLGVILSRAWQIHYVRDLINQ